MTSPPTYEFGDVHVDVGRMVVLKEGQPVAIEPKTFDVLRFLIEHRDRVVMKEELLDVVWRDTFVTPNVLTRAIAQLRKAIGDNARESRYIETIATRGYRFIAPVAEAPTVAAAAVAPEVPAAQASAPASRTWAISAVIFAIAAVAVAALVVGTRRGAHPAAASGGLPEVRRLVGANAGYFSQPSLSPDGQAVAYVSDKSGPLEIYVVGLAAGSREIAITSDGQQNVEPAWSPDGQWIAYYSRGRNGIWIVPATGGTPRQVTDSGSEPAWSPDSQQLVYSSYAGSFPPPSNLWIVRRDGSDRHPLTRLGMPNGGLRQPTWSHDGKVVAFVLVDPTAKFSIWMVSVADGRTWKLTVPEFWMFNGDATSTANPTFAFNDRTLYFSGATANANHRILRVALTDGYEAAGAPTPVMAFDGVMDGLSIARDGRAVYGLYSEDSNLWSVDVRNGDSQRKSVRLTNGQRNFRASYSTNGRIAYTRVNIGSPASSWTMKDDGTDQEPLVTDFQAVAPQWVRDGSRLLVWELTSNNQDKVWWVDAVTRRTTAIPLDVSNAAEPRISPDGTTLAFHVVQPDGQIQVWSQLLAGGPRRQLTSEQIAVSYPNWSRDGKWLSVEISTNNGTQVGVIPSEGGRVAQLTNDRGQNWPTTWSPDDEWIAFAGERGDVWNLWTVSRRTREEHQLTHFMSASGYVRWPTWSPRGDRIVFERDIWTGNVWLTMLP